VGGRYGVPRAEGGVLHIHVCTGESLKMGVHTCAGCNQVVTERVVLHVRDRGYWHSKCLVCTHCQSDLSGEGTCFVREGRLYCRDDYRLLFGLACGSCNISFKKDKDWMRTAGPHRYHISCFRCKLCKRQLNSQEKYHLVNGSEIWCTNHVGEGDETRLTTKKAKRNRSSFTEAQTNFLIMKFNMDKSPDGNELEKIANDISLPKRVTQVWFQNQRARLKKARAYAEKMKAGGGGDIKGLSCLLDKDHLDDDMEDNSNMHDSFLPHVDWSSSSPASSIDHASPRGGHDMSCGASPRGGSPRGGLEAYDAGPLSLSLSTHDSGLPGTDEGPSSSGSVASTHGPRDDMNTTHGGVSTMIFAHDNKMADINHPDATCSLTKQVLTGVYRPDSSQPVDANNLPSLHSIQNSPFSGDQFYNHLNNNNHNRSTPTCPPIGFNMAPNSCFGRYTGGPPFQLNREPCDSNLAHSDDGHFLQTPSNAHAQENTVGHDDNRMVVDYTCDPHSGGNTNNNNSGRHGNHDNDNETNHRCFENQNDNNDSRFRGDQPFCMKNVVVSSDGPGFPGCHDNGFQMQQQGKLYGYQINKLSDKMAGVVEPGPCGSVDRDHDAPSPIPDFGAGRSARSFGYGFNRSGSGPIDAGFGSNIQNDQHIYRPYLY